MTADEVIALLDLKPLPMEGGYFRETYRDDILLPPDALPTGYPGRRSLSTAIYYLLTPTSYSALHRLRGPEVYHFYLGDTVELWTFDDSVGTTTLLGSKITNGENVQHVVPADVWQGSRLREGGTWALVGTTMAPGFDFADYEHGQRESLVRAHPTHRDIIEHLTPQRD